MVFFFFVTLWWNSAVEPPLWRTLNGAIPGNSIILPIGKDPSYLDAALKALELHTGPNLSHHVRIPIPRNSLHESHWDKFSLRFLSFSFLHSIQKKKKEKPKWNSPSTATLLPDILDSQLLAARFIQARICRTRFLLRASYNPMHVSPTLDVVTRVFMVFRAVAPGPFMALTFNSFHSERRRQGLRPASCESSLPIICPFAHMCDRQDVLAVIWRTFRPCGDVGISSILSLKFRQFPRRNLNLFGANPCFFALPHRQGISDVQKYCVLSPPYSYSYSRIHETFWQPVHLAYLPVNTWYSYNCALRFLPIRGAHVPGFRPGKKQESVTHNNGHIPFPAVQPLSRYPFSP